MRVKRYSIVLVVYENGKAWYKCGKGRSVPALRNYFTKRSDFRYGKIFDYKDGSVGSQTGFFTIKQWKYYG